MSRTEYERGDATLRRRLDRAEKQLADRRAELALLQWHARFYDDQNRYLADWTAANQRVLRAIARVYRLRSRLS